MSCDLFSEYAVATQLCLGLSIVGVLCVEYLIEKCRKGDQARTFVQFWFDSFKLCCGAFVTHGFNVLVALLLNTDITDECAVYMIAFYYEATGVTLVQMLQYGLIKYSRKKYLKLKYFNDNKHTICSKIFFWISYPGHYTLHSIKIEQERELISSTKEEEILLNDDDNDNDSDIDNNNETSNLITKKRNSNNNYNSIKQDNNNINNNESGYVTFLHTRLASRIWQIILVLVTVIGTVLVLLFSNFILGYPSWISLLLAISAGIMFATLVIATKPVIYQCMLYPYTKIIYGFILYIVGFILYVSQLHLILQIS